jgi:hypothetical protein
LGPGLEGYRGLGGSGSGLSLPPHRCLPHAHGGAAKLLPGAPELVVQAAYDLIPIRSMPQRHDLLHLALHLRLDLVQRRHRRVVT